MDDVCNQHFREAIAPHLDLWEESERPPGIGMICEKIKQLRARLAAAEAALADQCFYADPRHFKRSGYTLDAGRDTEIRDIEYRDAKVYPTPEEAVAAKIAEYQGKALAGQSKSTPP